MIWLRERWLALCQGMYDSSVENEMPSAARFWRRCVERTMR